MTVEIIVAGSSMIVAVVAVGGVVVSWRRNGKTQAKRDERLTANQEGILKRLDDPKHGLAAIDDKVNNMVNHCATVSTGLTERMKTAERDIKEVKSRRRSHKAP